MINPRFGTRAVFRGTGCGAANEVGALTLARETVYSDRQKRCLTRLFIRITVESAPEKTFCMKSIFG